VKLVKFVEQKNKGDTAKYRWKEKIPQRVEEIIFAASFFLPSWKIV